MITTHSERVTPDPSAPHPTSERLVRILLWTFVASIVFSLGGVLILKIAPGVMRFFGPYFTTLVKAPTWTYMSLLPILIAVMYWDRLGARGTLLTALSGAAIGAAAELLGTMTGFPFGAYAYTDWLGPKMLGHVPYFIPLSWYAMGLVCFDLARRVVSGAPLTVLVGALFMVAWDVSLDPAMSRAFPFWTYGVDGFFYGMPLSNWAGWFVTSAAIMVAFTLIVGEGQVRHRLAPNVFLLNCAFPFLLSLEYGLYGATVAGAVTTAIVISVVARRSRLLPIETNGPG